MFKMDKKKEREGYQRALTLSEYLYFKYGLKASVAFGKKMPHLVVARKVPKTDTWVDITKIRDERRAMKQGKSRRKVFREDTARRTAMKKRQEIEKMKEKVAE